MLYPFPGTLLRRNQRFRDRHKGERCFILGSGNSILDQDLTRLREERVMTQNNFHAHPQIASIAPDYHVVVPKYQSEEFDADWEAWLRAMQERLPEATELFLNENTAYLVERLGVLEGRVAYLRNGYHCALLRRAPVNLCRALMAVPTVLPLCLAIAIYMGFEKIILLGFDLDTVCRWHRPDTKRFYGKSPITANRAERALEERSETLGLKWINMWTIWRQCNLLKQAAEARGTRIVNATNGGLLDMFDRRPYEQCLT
jgi:hypothetical protein